MTISVKQEIERMKRELIYCDPFTRPHCLGIGDTRSGKTNLMLWLLENSISAHPHYVYNWFDLPKNHESLALSQFMPVQYIVPKGRDIEIKLNNMTDLEPYPITITRMESREDIYDPWPYVKKDCINVMCIEPFIIKAKYYGPVISKIFEKLIYRAIQGTIEVPATNFIDEVNNVAPNRKVAYDKAHLEGSLDFLHNVERLAGHGIQLIGCTQFYTELPFPTRKAMSGLQFIKRGAIFPMYDEPRLWEAPKHWQGLQPWETVIRWRDHTYSQNDITIPHYREGWEFGTIKYIGEPITADYFKEKDPLGPLPCDMCQDPHEIRGDNMICIGHSRILDIKELHEKGCDIIKEEEATPCHAD